MKNFWKLAKHIFWIALLTLFTQVGGLIYLVFIPLFRLITKRLEIHRGRRWLKLGSFFCFYLIISLSIIPPLAKSLSGRVPLPFSSKHVKPLHWGYFLLNRNYVKPQLKEIVLKTADKLGKAHPGSYVSYLDACFPFKNGYPLLPHISHNDGRKIDLAYFYKQKKSGKELNGKTPAPIGYGSTLEVRKGEVNRPKYCIENGHWNYNFTAKLFPKFPWRNYEFDVKRSRTMVSLFASNPGVGKVFLEPHVKARLGLQGKKLRSAGCHAVRHDDHIHVQL
ncbi:MAG: hypothetical protein MRZ79_15910 [Bacteroidia bacterium]|nr:hypothetical protein [Bacteroidia bacterium]